jgi:hypothetical protein
LHKLYFKYTLLSFLLLVLQTGSLLAAILYEPTTVPKTTFIANKGQWDNPSLFMANIPGGQLYIEPHAWHFVFENQQDLSVLHKHPRPFADDFKTYTVRGHAVRIAFEGGSEDTKIDAQQPKT